MSDSNEDPNVRNYYQQKNHDEWVATHRPDPKATSNNSGGGGGCLILLLGVLFTAIGSTLALWV